MKKWWIVSLMLCVAVAAYGLLQQPEKPLAVEGKQLQPQRVEEAVVCRGVLEAGEEKVISLPVSCIIGEVFVRTGQAVSAGDTLFTVDKEQSRAVQGLQREADALLLATIPETVTAPADGIVLAVKITDSALCDMDAPCVVLAPREGLQVRVAIREKELPSLTVGCAVTVSSDGFGEKRYRGQLTEIAATTKTSGGASVVEGIVQLDAGQANPTMRLGLSVKARMVTSVTEGALLLPYEALAEDARGFYVYVLQEGHARRRRVQVAKELADGALLSETTLAGQTVLLQPERLRNGMTVSVEQKGGGT